MNVFEFFLLLPVVIQSESESYSFIMHPEQSEKHGAAHHHHTPHTSHTRNKILSCMNHTRDSIMIPAYQRICDAGTDTQTLLLLKLQLQVSTFVLP